MLQLCLSRRLSDGGIVGWLDLRYRQRARRMVCIALCLFLSPMLTWAQNNDPPLSSKIALQSLQAVEKVQLRGIDATAERAAADLMPGPGPQLYAVPLTVNISPQTAGTTEEGPKGGKVWRVRVEVPGATDLNFGFSHYDLPDEATLHIVREGKDSYVGAYTSRDNKDHGQLWTAVVEGDSAVIELFVPSPYRVDDANLVLSQVGAGFRDLFNPRADLSKQSGACNIDVICPEGDPWRNEVRSVARYSIAGTGLCTGTLIMDASSSFRPFFLTANHCGITSATASTLVFFWNFESPNCGDRSGGVLTNTQSGASFRAARADADMALVELDSQPDPAFNVFYSGWDRTGTVPMGSVGIHHPSGDVKAISLNDDALTTGDSCIGPVGAGNTHWFVDNWEQGTTESGSSGSGLWDPATMKLVGFLSGGRAACGVIDLDCYGKFSEAWDGPAPSERLRDWLDPENLRTEMVEGAAPDGVVPPPPGFPVDIPDNDPAGVTHTIEVTEAGTVTDVRVNVQIDHVWVGDLQITLRSPAGTEVVLLDRPGVPNTRNGCSNDNMDVIFHDGASIDPEVECPGTIPWLRGEVLPANMLATLTGEASQGMWSLMVSDHSAVDIGQLVNWGLRFESGGDMSPPLPADIPDDDPIGVTVTQNITNNVTLTDVNVRVQIDHTWVGDLRIALKSPAGTEVVLLERPGLGVGSPNGCPDDNMEVTFDDSATLDTHIHCPGTTPWLMEEAMPVGSLASLNGESSAGTWRLTVSDNAGGDLGQLVNWELILQPPVGEPPMDAEPPGFEGTVEAHNVWRRQVGVPDITWSGDVAAIAQEWADQLASQDESCTTPGHRDDLGARNLGENLFWAWAPGSAAPPLVTSQNVVDSWGSESQDYDATTHTCAEGSVCGHYTQIVWRTTEQVGCGKASCESSQNGPTIIWVCNYSPPGNIGGETPF